MSPAVKDQLKKCVENLDLDCGDQSCKYAKIKLGMRTNGGCRCSRNKGEEVEFYLSTQLSYAKWIIDTLESNDGVWEED